MPDNVAPLFPPTTGNTTTPPFGLTPSQTVGPFWHLGMQWPDGPDAAPVGTPSRITLAITVLDGAGAPVSDAVVETWQADSAGRFTHAADPRGVVEPTPEGFRGFARSPADVTGTALIHTVKPGSLPTVYEDGASGGPEAPHVNVSIFARGMLDRLVTRMYFSEDAAAHTADPVLASLPERERAKLVATPDEAGYTWTIHLQDANPVGVETPFFDL